MDSKVTLAVILGTTFSNVVSAGTMGQEHHPIAPMVALIGDAAWSNNGQTQTFYLQPDVQKTYAATKKSQVLAVGELFFGVQTPVSNKLLGQLGIAFATTSSAKLNGDIWEDADPDFNNYTYQYALNHKHVVLKGKLLADLGKVVMPYLSASVGVGFNQSKDFTITPKLFQEIPAPAFGSNTVNAFTYSVGLGIQKDISEHVQAGIGYEFSDWGKSRLNPAAGQTINSGLSLSSFYTNALQISLSYTA